VTQRAEASLRQFAGNNQPFFIFAHYFDPHYNYLRHPEIGFAAPRVGRLEPGQDVELLYDMAEDLTPEEVQFLRDLYDEEIRYTDRGIGRLLSALRELDLYDDTLIVLVGDHGEEFIDHGNLGHARTLYNEVLRVPLVLRDPGDRGGPRVVEGPVSLVSLTPTILDLVGVESDRIDFQAKSFAPNLSSGEMPPPGMVYGEVDFGYYEVYLKALVTNGRKIIRDDVTGRIELYDLNADPFEHHDLAPDSPDAVRRLVPLLDRRIALARGEAVDPEEMTLSADELEQLRSLGYLEP
jgi:arylsulfatase A-like enzyme